jgi:hypothetical protein
MTILIAVVVVVVVVVIAVVAVGEYLGRGKKGRHSSSVLDGADLADEPGL